MKILVRLFICYMICTFTVPGYLSAQNISNPDYLRGEITGNRTPANTCRALTEEELAEISQNISNFMSNQFLNQLENVSHRQPEFDERFIFSDRLLVQISLYKKYNAYKDILQAQNWKESPWGNLTPQEISNALNTLSNEVYQEFKQNPFYTSDHFGQFCGESGMVLVDLAVFLVIAEYLEAALPLANTVTLYSAMSGFAWNFSTLFSSPPFLRATSNLGRISSTLIGWGTSVSVLDALHNFIKTSVLNLPERERTPQTMQENLHAALKQNFDLGEQIQEINNNSDLTPEQRQRRIDTRYKEAIIKIYALDYVKTYLTYAEKPEKYLWALLDLTTLLQSREFVYFGDSDSAKIEIEPLPRLSERTPEMARTLKGLTLMHIQGYTFQRHADNMVKEVEERAQRNLQNADVNFDF